MKFRKELLVVLAAILSGCGGGGGGDKDSGNSADTTPPTVVSTLPANAAVGIALSTAILVTASEAIDPATLNTASLTLVPSGGGAPVLGNVSVAGPTLTFTPFFPLADSTQYVGTVTTTVKDIAGNALATNFSWSFTTVTVPGAPTMGTAVATGSTTVTVNFTAPASNGGAPITGYTVTPNPGGAGIVDLDAGTTLLSHRMTGLTPGTPYTFTVTATNSVGSGPPPAVPSNNVTPIAGASPPGAPTFTVAPTAGNGQATVVFNTPASLGTPALILGYTVTSSPGGITASGGGTSIVVPGLTNGTSYAFTAVASNSTGPGPASLSSAPVTPAGLPGAPTGASAGAGALPVGASGPVGMATVTFSAPASNGGSAITGYAVTSNPGGGVDSNAGSPTLSHVVTGLTVGTPYTFTVTAVNAIGPGAPSVPSNSTTPTAAVTVPGAPTGVTATGGSAQATVSFTAPASNGGSPILNYMVTALIGGVPTAITASGGGTTIVVPGLTNGTAYTFTVNATNAIGTGAASGASSAVTPATVPGAPTAASAVAGNGQATVNFAAPASNGGAAITGYTVTSNPGGIIVLVAGAVPAAVVVTGLTNGVAYTFTVRATNNAGNSAPSAASNSATPTAGTVPGAPTGASATAGNAQATVTFAAPGSNGGSAITGYTVTSSPGGLTGTSIGAVPAPVTITGLTNGTAYTFTVAATNAIGTGPASGASNSLIPATVPGAPTAVSAIAGDAKATISFTPPASNGGSPIILNGYTVTSSPGGITATGNASPIVVNGLTNVPATAYTFTVTATNSIGTGAPSTPSNSATPSPTATVPGAPTGASATAGNAQATVTFAAPGSNGGSAITGYTVTSSPGGLTGTSIGAVPAPVTITGLTNGTAYTFTVAATNAIGTGPASGASNSLIPATVPGAPTAVSAIAGDAKATISFTPPASNGGSPIILNGYTVTSSPGGITATGNASPIVVNGLTNVPATAYTFTVTATNSIGTGAPSTPSNSATPSPTATVPGAPTGASATAGNAQATVTFAAPGSNGGSAITGYTVTSNPAGGVDSNAGTTGLSHLITGLTNGTAYTFTVAATNAIGTSPPSGASNSVTPITVPGAPQAVSAIAGNAQVTVSFSAPVSNGGSTIFSYTVASSPGGIIATGSASPIVVNGLTNGQPYTFTVNAVNSAGPGPAALSGSVTPTAATVPGAPTGASATAGNTQATVTFAAPGSNGGSAITGYTVTSNPGGLTGTSIGAVPAPVTITGLTNGTAYTFTVIATNAVGTSPASSPSNSATPASAPGAPTSVFATAGDGQASVAFAAPSNGGSPITIYTVRALILGVSAGISAIGGSSPINVPGLANGTAYTFTVQATNAIGNGPDSAQSNSVTPQGIPPACSTTTPVVSGAISLRAGANRALGVSPLGVFFDATATTSSATTNPFHDIQYLWDFGDPASGTWTNTPGMGNVSRNAATGAVAAHVYEPAAGNFSGGIATFTATVTAFDGTNTAACSIQVTVQNPASIFSGGNTICFSNNTDFTGCPSGATQAPPTANFETAISANFGTTKRLLFHAGHTFVTANGVNLNSAGPNTLGAFPIGSSARISFTLSTTSPVGAITIRDNVNELRIMDLEIAGAGAVNTPGVDSSGYAPSKVTMLRLNVHDVNLPIKPFGADEVVVQDSTVANLSGNPGSNSGHGIMFGTSRLKAGTNLLNKYTALLGNTITMGAASNKGQVYGIRGELARYSVISNNFFDPGPFTTFGAIKIATILPFTAEADIAKFIIISDNVLIRGPQSFGVIGTGPNIFGEDTRSHDIIVERNWFKGMPGTGGGGNVMMNVAAPFFTVRNNLFDTTSGNGGGGYPIWVHFVGATPVNNVFIYNNSLFGNDASTFGGTMQAIRVESAVTVTARNNIGYFPNPALPVMFQDASSGAASITATNNTCNTSGCTAGIATSPNFTSTPPTANPSAWKPTAGSTAIGTGAVVPVWSDFFLTPQPSPRDRGAVNH